MIYVLSHSLARQRAIEAVREAPEGYVIRIGPQTRSLEQSAKMWAMLHEVAAQVEWHGRKMDAESWKFVFSSSIKKQDVVPNLDNTGFVVLGQSTSRMTKAEMSEMIELISAFGAQHDVVFRDLAIDTPGSRSPGAS